MKHRSFILFLISIFFFILEYTLALTIDFNDDDVVILGIIGSLLIGSSFTGIVIGLSEAPSRKKWLSITGNAVLLITLLITIWYGTD